MKLSGNRATELTKWLLSLLAGTLAFYSFDTFDDIRLTATTLVALSGTLTGFILTALSMLVGIADRPFILKLRQTGHYSFLVKGAFTSAALWLVVVVFGVLGHLTTDQTQQIILSIAVLSMVHALWFFVGLGIKFRRVLVRLARS